MTRQNREKATLVLSRDQVRRIDQIAIEQYGIPGVVLMENAGRCCVEKIMARGVNHPVVICCGPGNNGGDGFVMARHLDIAGVDVKVILTGLPVGGTASGSASDAYTNFQIIQKMGISIVDLSGVPNGDWLKELQSVSGRATGWVVDALLGTGATGAPRPPLVQLIPMMNSISALRLAVDIPTGMDCDTGECHEPVFQADITCTFVAAKPAFSIASALPNVGEVQVINIGVPISAIHQACN